MIKVGYLISYDYEFFFTSVKQIYEFADKIYLAIDKDGKTWSGNNFEIPQSFFNEVKQFDCLNKIEFYYDSFYVETLSPIENDVRERTMLSKKMGRGWLIQLDVDEYIYDFELVVKYLRRNIWMTFFPVLTPISFRGRWVTLFKKVDDGYLYIDNGESFAFITNLGSYQYARDNNQIYNHSLDLITIHQSWARNELEIEFKIKNWGHTNDFDTLEYLRFWKSLTKENYKEFKNFHPMSPKTWKNMEFLESNEIDDFITKYSNLKKQNLVSLPMLYFFKKIAKTMVKKKIRWQK